MMHVFEKSLRIPASAERAFAWHEEPGTLAKLIPPGDPIRIVEHTGGIRDGARVVLRMGPIRWVAIHQGYVAGRQFQDRQQSGPFRSWLHTHSFESDGPDACVLRDHVDFELPLSPFSEIAMPLVRRKLEKTFAYRHRVTMDALGNGFADTLRTS